MSRRPPPQTCEHCAAVVNGGPVEAVSRRTGAPASLYLCHRCLADPGRTWRLKWLLVDEIRGLR
jgi:hypothetical protein